VRAAAAGLRETLAAYRAKEDLITIGAYTPGADAGVDYAIAMVPQIEAFLRQPADEATDAAETDRRLVELMADRGAGTLVVEPPPGGAPLTLSVLDTPRLLDA
jgi:flagellum-specific ATP synthase